MGGQAGTRNKPLWLLIKSLPFMGSPLGEAWLPIFRSPVVLRGHDNFHSAPLRPPGRLKPVRASPRVFSCPKGQTDGRFQGGNHFDQERMSRPGYTRRRTVYTDAEGKMNPLC